MDEKNKEEPEDKQSAKDTGDGVQSEADKQVEQLNADTERINKAIAENENAKATQKLSGVAEAGQTAKVETEDEKWAKDAKERYAGTGMDPTDDDSPTEFK